ncbi:hypothetical protein FisN_9Lh174 [Fistulifera solaris]|uniref:Dienelactone hydrolase domain-containing protein n=1 Tax=Fistulifera solaris TaxID=1519565 RepID=A0A1Z5KKN3_FISSO|nr:hypothetical protein FisN_9Lh174 [Fistulifera solaris]|eukprot:GAX26880.1 hypothetical protein FisN_9Lh174 [Fistulifera solaris]
MHWLLICCCLGSIGTTVSFLFSASTTGFLQPRISMTTEDDFVPLNPESLSATSCLIEQTLCQPSSERPQLAKDFHYASAVLDAWRQEELNSETAWCAEYKSVIYHDSDGTPLYGHWVRKQGSHESDNFGILLFHTGAGPHDIFLLWKAASLVMTLDCQVLIADILSDESGWAWDLNRSRYETVRQRVLEGGETRPLLQKRIHAAVSLLKNQVDENRLAALGWCLGGHSILELARMTLPEMLAMVTFHGVFDGIKAPAESVAVSSAGAEVLICNGVEDPFVSSQTLENALATFQQYGYRLSLLQLKGAKHGFTNPAQDFNDNPAFAFHTESARKSWHQATALLKRRCSNLP